jgi:hypothetical protein
MHMPQEHLSVVVLFNHEADAAAAANDVLLGVLNHLKPKSSPVEPSAEWNGVFLDQDAHLAITVRSGQRAGELIIAYAGHFETGALKLTDAARGQAWSMTAAIEGDILRIHRVAENRKLEARRVVMRDTSLAHKSPPGDYYCAEADSTFHCRQRRDAVRGV